MSLTVEKCLQAWTNSLRQMNAKADIVFFGDSLTYYGDFSSVFPGKVVCNLGLRGDTIQGMIERIDQVQLLETKSVFLMAGINDLAPVSVDEFEKMYNLLIDAVDRKLPNTSIFVQTILPVNTQDFRIGCDNTQICECNNRINKVAWERNLFFLDTHSLYAKNNQLPLSLTKDGIHICQDAYSIWYKALERILSKKYNNNNIIN